MVVAGRNVNWPNGMKAMLPPWKESGHELARCFGGLESRTGLLQNEGTKTQNFERITFLIANLDMRR
jgi:hypothetical protein